MHYMKICFFVRKKYLDVMMSFAKNQFMKLISQV